MSKVDNCLERISKITHTELYKIISSWKEYLIKNRNYSLNTIINYLNDTFVFVKLLNSLNLQELCRVENLSDISRKDLHNLLFDLTGQREINSRSRLISSLKNLFSYCKKQNFFDNQEIFNIKQPKRKQQLPRAVSNENILHISNNLAELYNEKDEWVVFRDYCLIMLQYTSGLRISEAINLKMSDVNIAGFIRVYGKGGKERITPILTDVYQNLQELSKICPYYDNNDKILFYGERGKPLDAAIFQRKMRQIKQYFNLEQGVTPHALRHSFATALLSSSKDLFSIKELLGHNSIKSTQIYTKIAVSDMLSDFEDYE